MFEWPAGSSVQRPVLAAWHYLVRANPESIDPLGIHLASIFLFAFDFVFSFSRSIFRSTRSPSLFFVCQSS